MKSSNNAFFAFLVFSLILVVGCGGAYRATTVQNAPLEQTERVIYKNFWLKTNVGILKTESETENGFLKAKLQMKNLTSSTVNAEIKIKFLDSKGYEIEDNVGWMPLPLESGEIKSYQRIAPTKNAADYRVLLKLASDSGD